MRLDPSIKGFVSKRRRLDRAIDLMDRGRLCIVHHCLVEGDHAVAFRHRREHGATELGLCAAHLRAMEQDRPTLPLRRGWVCIASRPLGEDEILDGPLGYDE